MDVEEIARSKVAGMIAKCPHLTSLIDAKDKIPHTDGSIDIQSEEGKAKTANFARRATVQVKGRTIGQGSSPQKHFRLQRPTLEAYLQLRGLLFLVVYIEENTFDEHVFYAILRPLVLDKLLSEAPNDPNTWIQFELKPFPDNPAAIERIVKFTAQAHQEDHRAVADQGAWSKVDGVSVLTSEPLSNREPIRLNRGEHDFSIRLTTRDGFQAYDRSVYEIRLIPDIYIEKCLDLSVSSGGVVFENPISRRTGERSYSLDLSDTLSIHHDASVDGNQEDWVEVGMNPRLDKRVKDIQFVLSSGEESGFYIDDEYIRWEMGDLPDEDELRRYFSHLKQIREVLEEVGARLDLIDLGEVTEEQHRQLRDLHAPLVRGKEVTPDRPIDLGRILQPIGGDRAIELLLFEGAEEGGYRLQHLFDPKLERRFYHWNETDEGPEGFPVTAYEVLGEEDFPRTLNLRLDMLVDSYDRISEYENTGRMANETVLDLINAADRDSLRADELLAAAEELNCWLIDECGEEPASVINSLQITLRRRILSADERKRIRDLQQQIRVGDMPMKEVAELSCALLLDDVEGADYYFDKLSEDVQETVRNWPIWTLRRQIDEPPEG